MKHTVHCILTTCAPRPSRRSMSMGDMPTEEEAMGSVPPLNQSRFERTHETLHNFEEEDDGWQDVRMDVVVLRMWERRRPLASLFSPLSL